ncbi:PDDEXK family nuclease [Corynebacterium epidermidicanis]|uniref:DUF559 domain-containing protein n=1 Tax=Corynebacterium epidermidicanis TaxID=1050174 RepID=A0A0G3GT04_9CORY|nr:hypothetical protein [Corynebacterium epidermidicanis]AKK04311.1 hypothetical protein CEPID_12445 [Corynebacterium epidermidicanis]
MRLDSDNRKPFVLVNSQKVPRSNERFWRGVAQEDFIRVHGKFYVDRKRWDRLRTWEKEEAHACAVGWSSISAVLVGRSAAIVHGLPVISRAWGAELVAELNYPAGKRKGGRQGGIAGILYRGHHLSERHVHALGDLRVTSKARTVIDCARYEEFENALVIAEGALRQSPKLRAEIEELLKEMKGSPGLPKARRVLQFAGTQSESAAESRAKAQFITAGLHQEHKIKQNPELLIDGTRYRPDFLIDGWLIVEIDGMEKYFGKHLPPDEALRAERLREVKLQNAGYRVLRFGWDELEAKSVVGDVKAAIRAQRLSVPLSA